MFMASMTELAISEVRDAASGQWLEDLPPGAVHLWQLQLDASPALLTASYASLSSEERERAQRFRVARPRTAFVLTRGMLRAMLAHYLGGKPHEVRFCYEAQGKPFL